MEGKRRCIKCETTMEVADVVGVEIDCCPGCGGIWLDGGEINALAKQSDSAKRVEQLRAKVQDLDATDAVRKAADATRTDVLNTACPSCSGKLLMVVFGPTAAEHCTSCLGLFLDKGELEKAMELVGSDRATTIVALAGSAQTAGTIGG